MNVGGLDYVIRISDFNHDDKADGSGKAAISFDVRDCLPATQQMNATNTNVGGWQGSKMYSYYANTLMPSIELMWREVMTPIIKLTSAGNRASNIVSSVDTAFSYSEIEAFGSLTYSFPGEGAHYPIFSTDVSRIKTRVGTASTWRLRSPYSGSATGFCGVAASGGPNHYYYSNANLLHGAAFGFCI